MDPDSAKQLVYQKLRQKGVRNKEAAEMAQRAYNAVMRGEKFSVKDYL